MQLAAHLRVALHLHMMSLRMIAHACNIHKFDVGWVKCTQTCDFMVCFRGNLQLTAYVTASAPNIFRLCGHGNQGKAVSTQIE